LRGTYESKIILTKAVLARIPELVAYGLSRSEIAERLGCKLSTLKVRCSQERIQLSRPRRGPRELASQNQADHDQHGRRGTVRFHGRGQGMTASAFVSAA
jgi:hypothetical protein